MTVDSKYSGSFHIKAIYLLISRLRYLIGKRKFRPRKFRPGNFVPRKFRPQISHKLDTLNSCIVKEEGDEKGESKVLSGFEEEKSVE